MTVPYDYCNPLNSMCAAGGSLERKESPDITPLSKKCSLTTASNHSKLKYVFSYILFSIEQCETMNINSNFNQFRRDSITRICNSYCTIG